MCFYTIINFKLSKAIRLFYDAYKNIKLEEFISRSNNVMSNIIVLLADFEVA